MWKHVTSDTAAVLPTGSTERRTPGLRRGPGVRRGREAMNFRRITLKSLTWPDRQEGRKNRPSMIRFAHRNYLGRPEGDQPMPEAGILAHPVDVLKG